MKLNVILLTSAVKLSSGEFMAFCFKKVPRRALVFTRSDVGHSIETKGNLQQM